MRKLFTWKRTIRVGIYLTGAWSTWELTDEINYRTRRPMNEISTGKRIITSLLWPLIGPVISLEKLSEAMDH